MNKYYILLITILCSCGLVESDKKGKEQEPRESKSTYRHRNLDELDRNWKARGLQAQEYLNRIGSKKDLTDKEMCKYRLEIAYHQHTMPEGGLPSKSTQMHFTSYLLYIGNNEHKNSSSPNEVQDDIQFAGISYNYDDKGIFRFSAYESIGEGWIIRHIPEINWAYLLSGHGCHFFIDIKDPFRARVMSERERPMI